MKRFSTILFVVCVLVIAASLPVVAVHAAPAAGIVLQESQQAQVPSLDQLLGSLLSLGGFAALVTCLINAGKTWNLIPDGKAPAVSLSLNLVGLVGLAVLQLSGKSDLVPVIDANAGALAQALTAVLALVYQLYISRVAHTGALAGVPVIGKSYSGRAAGAGLVVEISREFPESVG
jgi:hypothetical protein